MFFVFKIKCWVVWEGFGFRVFCFVLLSFQTNKPSKMLDAFKMQNLLKL